MDLSALVSMSNRYGANPAYVLAGGGNTSVKEDDCMYVKASGTKLATITEEGFVPVSRRALHATMEKNYPKSDKEREAAFLLDVQASRILPGETRRPSVEALLHALFPQKYVLHIHPAKLNGLTCSTEGETAARKLFGDDVIWIPLCRPGYVLGSLCWEAMNSYKAAHGKDADTILLQNHGVFVAADTLEEIDALFAKVYTTITAKISCEPDLTPVCTVDDTLCEKVAAAAGYPYALHCGSTEAVKLSRSKDAAAPLLRPFTPDHIVACGAYPLYVETADDVIPTGKNRVIILKDHGYFALGEDRRSAEIVASLVNDAMCIAISSDAFGGPLHMTEEMTDFITNWEAESYRRKQF